MPAGYAPYSTQAQNAMAKVFQYKMMGILEELVSPIVTPYILAKHLRGRSLELVDFFRNFTVNVQGTGDVCAFAMLNIKDNGNSAWKPSDSVDTTDGHSAELHLPPLGTGPPEMEMVNLKLGHVPDMNASQVPQSLLCTENGKLELSLIHFKLTNPDWIPSEGGQQKFIDFVTSNAIKEDVEPETASTSEAEPSTTSAMRQSMRRSLHPNVESVTRDENELFSLSRERVRVINGEHPSSISSRLNSNLQMTLSTLFLHEYAATHSTTGHSAVPVTENDPLLLSANRPRTSYS
ncbi:Autophagy-related protein 9A [Halotydeus destructor]|nr:Autophagy-related protein 9A [Halotydeus destructor]